MDEIAQLTPSFHGVSYDKLEALGSIQWPCNEQHPEGTPIMHQVDFPIGKGNFSITPYLASEERANRRFPLLLTTGRILSQYNVGAQTRRTPNQTWHDEDVIEIHQPGVVYTTFHHPFSGANVITTDNSDWATNCPEYKVTAVQVEKVSQPSVWQRNFKAFNEQQMALLAQGHKKQSRKATLE
jgi:formate dehydrogenase major subunit